MKKIALIFISVTIILSIRYMIGGIKWAYEYERNVSSYWTLADKSSTIADKAIYIDQFVAALDKQNLNGTYNAVIYPTMDNSFDSNFAALKTLQKRLHEIQGMDVTSFQYQTAIQQITAQEQGEAKAMLDELEGAWYLKYHCYYWNWYCGLVIACLMIMAVVGIIGGIVTWDD